MTGFLEVFLITLSAGFLGGLVGLGGGFLIVPLFVIVLNLPIHVAVGLSLASVAATAFSSFIIYALRRLVDFRLGLFLEASTIIGALISSNIAIYLKGEVIEVIFAVVLFYTAYRMFRHIPIHGDGSKTRSMSRGRWILGSLGAFAAGFASGMLGIGGGLLKVPIMVLILSTPMRTAIATSMFMISITAPTAASTYILHGLLTPDLLLAGIIGAAAGAQAGSRVSLRTGTKILRKIFSLLLVIFAAMMLFKGLGFLG